jgi:hypothetical protein
LLGADLDGKDIGKLPGEGIGAKSGAFGMSCGEIGEKGGVSGIYPKRKSRERPQRKEENQFSRREFRDFR